MKNKMIYFMVMIFTVIIYAFFNSHAARDLFAFEVVLIPWMFLMSIYLTGNINANIEIPYYHARKNSEFMIKVHLNNQSFLPITVCYVKVKCTNSLTGKAFYMSEYAMVDGKRESVLEFYLQSFYCGKYEVRIEEIRVYDYLRIFSNTKKWDSNTDEVLILPQFRKIMIGGTAVTRARHEWEQYSHTSSGEDTSEVFDVHEYRNGDTFQRVHWKLTAKTNQYLVKEYSMPLENMIFLFLDLHCENVENIIQEKLDHFFEVLAAISWSLAWEGINHAVVWYSMEKRGLEISHIEYEKNVYSMVEKIFGEKFYEDYRNVRLIYNVENEKIKEDCSLTIDVNGNVYRGDVCIKSFDSQNLEKQIVEWKLEI